MARENCKHCHYFYQDPARTKRLGAQSGGECRRFPPQLVALPSQTEEGASFGVHATFPVVPVNAFCGEWTERKRIDTSSKLPPNAQPPGTPKH